MEKFKNPEVAEIFAAYPEHIRKKLILLRQYVFETAAEIESIDEIEETLKWGEPSYLVKGGSTIRINWKHSNPTQYAMYFHCKTSLVDTFKELYGSIFKTEGNRAIIFDVNDEVSVEALKHCIMLALTYHRNKKSHNRKSV